MLRKSLPFGHVEGQRVDRDLRLPSGWDDAFFDRIDQGADSKTVVAVLDFSGGEVLQPHLRFSMSAMLITSLVQVGRFTVVERSRIEDLLQEQQLILSGFVDPATAVEVGKMLGAELVVHGLVTKATEQMIDKFAYDLVRIEVGVDIRAVNTNSGEIVISETAEAATEERTDGFRPALRERDLAGARQRCRAGFQRGAALRDGRCGDGRRRHDRPGRRTGIGGR
jgi:hypothetical protein